tara:strand:- start:28 stop:465 length:438 start_codon:yes stop_codon:yes gene_type:complete
MNNIRIHKLFLLILFSGFSLAEQINFDCECESIQVHWYDEDGNNKKPHDSPVLRDTTIMFDTNKKTILYKSGLGGPYKESELFLEWVTLYDDDGEENNHYVEHKFNRVTGVLSVSQYFSLSSWPKQGILLRSSGTFNCKKIKKLL